jgi:diguanylate cyclase (GGDEF)-like protein
LPRVSSQRNSYKILKKIMKIDRLHEFHSQTQSELSSDGIETHLYYYFDSEWYKLASEPKNCDETRTGILERAKKDSVAYHPTNSLDAWFYFDFIDSVVQLVFSKSPQKTTRVRYRKKLLKIHESASNAYKVSHNPLTHLLAKDAFRERLARAITDVDKVEPHSDEAQENGFARVLAVMALDIDHFKQINDTRGHLYGDQVLKTFGIRLEKCAEGIRSRSVGKPEIYVGHPSGEEFLILIQANALREQFIEWANEFRKKIADEVLPSDDEWKWLSNSGNIKVLSLPSPQDRAVTMSVGVALYDSASTLDQKAEAVSDLLDRADAALYRAKAAGRNQVIFYDEILSNCGRVIEQDQNTRVVALDIGSKVGVSIGQEFKVFSPTFSGNTMFMIHDGRTNRTLGVYPQVQSARIVVFNTQTEISFAYIAELTNQETIIEAGSHIEAIPTGSIGHLLPSFSKYFPTSPDKLKRSETSELQDFMKSSGASFAVVVRFTREAEYLRKYGSVALNTALALLYREAQLAFHAAKFIEVLDQGSICIVGTKSAYKEKIVEDFVQTMASEMPELGVFVGIFCEADRDTPDGGDKKKLDSTNALEFARFAAADVGRDPDTRLRHFNSKVAESVVLARWESRSFKVGYADFEKLRSLGVESARLLNLGGLIARSLGLRQQALEHYAAAIAKDPKSLIYKSNYGIAAYQAGDIDSALKILNTLTNDELDKLHTSHPYGYFNYARLLARGKQNGSAFFDPTRFKLIASNALSIADYGQSQESEIIKEALVETNEVTISSAIREKKAN